MMPPVFDVVVPDAFLPERKYIIDTTFTLFLGVEYRLLVEEVESVYIKSGGKYIVLNDVLFAAQTDDWLSRRLLPRIPLASSDVAGLPFSAESGQDELPVLYGGPEVEIADSSVTFDVDIFGSCFFMLSRYEEYVCDERDEHGRFPSLASISTKAGFLHRPIVNEYVELLYSAMKYLWPELDRRENTFAVSPSHDVDRAYEFYNMSIFTVIKFLLDGFYIGKPASFVLKRFAKSLLSKITLGGVDPFNTFSFIMDNSEERGLSSEFYFLTAVTNVKKDASYSLNDRSIKNLMRDIAGRGHVIGLHPSYGSYLDSEQTQAEFDLLKRHCGLLNIEQQQWGGRQHYLRWEFPATLNNWVKAGLDYDSSVYFSDAPGFRSGCCLEYPLYDLLGRECTPLHERPLAFMDSSIMDADDTDIDMQKSKQLIYDLKSSCRRYGGRFTFLWHNSNLASAQQRELYKYALDC
jgi:hypothetical protein